MAIYLKLDGVEGECEKANYEKWIECLNWNWGASNPSSAAFGQGMAAGTVAIHEIALTSVTGGKASLQMLNFMTKGKHFGELCLDITKATGDDTEGVWFQIKSTSAMITSYSTGGDSEASPHNPQMDSFTIALGNYAQEIWTQATDGGALSTAGNHGFDIKTKTAT
jgi:type VI secretion system secreted protein Hcp